jgi:glutamate decarboxylase
MGEKRGQRPIYINPLFGAADPVLGVKAVLPRDRLPEGPMAAATASRLIRDELMLDGNARLNLATFVTTWMEPEAAALMGDTADKNLVDRDEYPVTAELERRCVAMLGHLWNAPDPDAAVGCSTVGSSEGCMLGGMALKRRWMHGNADRYAAGARPNLVMGTNVQVCWKKFCKFWEVEARLVPMEGDRFHLGAEEAAELCDENTIGVVAVLGSTMDGSYEPVAEICDALDALEERMGWHVPVHVDAASGGMIAPFLEPELEWDFRVPRVASINASGHKYGLVYPGVGWALWRDQEALPEDLVERVNYLGGDMPTFSLNFSRPGSQVIAQYYNFLRLGHEGFRAVQRAIRDVAMYLAEQIEALGSSVSSTFRGGCGNRVGWCRRTPSRRTARTWRCCGSCAATGSHSTWPTGWSRIFGTCCRGCAGSPDRYTARTTSQASTTDGAHHRASEKYDPLHDGSPVGLPGTTRRCPIPCPGRPRTRVAGYSAAAQVMQVLASGRAARRSGTIGRPQLSQVP